MGNLDGKRVLVTGAGQGLGHSIAEHFVEAGANVAVHYFSSEEGAKEFLKLCPQAEYVNVTDAGHMVAGDRNDIFAEAVLDFLARRADAG